MSPDTLIINGSPKLKNSATSVLIEMLSDHLQAPADIISVNFNNFKQNIAETVNKYKKVVICTPLYADGLPSHLLETFTISEKFIHPHIQIYALVNCGLIEGIHAKQALDIIQNFATRCKAIYMGGIGIGGCGGLYEMKQNNILRWFSRKINKRLKEFAYSISASQHIPNIYTKIGLTRILYKIVGNHDWKKQIKAQQN